MQPMDENGIRFLRLKRFDVQNCAKCAKLYKMCEIVQNVQNCATCAKLCKICNIVQTVQYCSKCAKLCKMCKRGTRVSPRYLVNMEYLSNRWTKMESVFCV